jgi:hypothetical protein
MVEIMWQKTVWVFSEPDGFLPLRHIDRAQLDIMESIYLNFYTENVYHDTCSKI